MSGDTHRLANQSSLQRRNGVHAAQTLVAQPAHRQRILGEQSLKAIHGGHHREIVCLATPLVPAQNVKSAGVKAPLHRPGNFIGEHLHKEYEGGWLHCDIAGPASIEERGTGFGVALVLGILEVEGFAA